MRHVSSWQHQSVSEKIWALKRLLMELTFMWQLATGHGSALALTTDSMLFKRTSRTQNKGLPILAKMRVIAALATDIL